MTWSALWTGPARPVRPRMILVVGGPYIWPFVEPLGLGTLDAAARPLYLAGQRDGIDWIVGIHPGGASRLGWGPSRYADLIEDTARALRSSGGQQR